MSSLLKSFDFDLSSFLPFHQGIFYKINVGIMKFEWF